MNTKKPVVLSVAALMTVVAAVAVTTAQTPADVATRLSGTWKMNRDLSPGFSAGRGRGRAGGVRYEAVRYEVAIQGPGGGGGGGGQSLSDMTPAEIDAMKAIQAYQQLPDQMKIDATAESVTFTDVRGARTFPVDDKTMKIDAGVTKINGKSKWDKGALRQEFWSPQTKVIYLWTPSADGKQLSFTLKIEDNRAPREQKAVFDKQ